VWSQGCPHCRNLKVKLTSAPVLAYPSFDKPFTVKMDACIDGLGAILPQKQHDSKVHPVAFVSRSLTPAKHNYGITELEVFTVVWALMRFHPYL